MVDHVLTSMNEMVTQEYSSSHQALDLVGAGHSVDDVMAYADGVVEIVVSDVTTNNKRAVGTASYGNFVKIRHDDGTKTLYAHLQSGSVSVKTGDYVSKGQKLGRMGNTGNAQGIHLHFEMRMSNEKRVNPYYYLWQKPVVTGETETTKENELKKEEVKDNNVEKPNALEPNNEIDVPKPTTDTNTISSNKPKISNDNQTSSEVSSDENIYLSNFEYKHGSIVDGLKTIGVDSSFDYRSELAHKNGIDNYHGSYAQNVKLLSLLKQGKLIKA